jgi:hypothetical protein
MVIQPVENVKYLAVATAVFCGVITLALIAVRGFKRGRTISQLIAETPATRWVFAAMTSVGIIALCTWLALWFGPMHELSTLFYLFDGAIVVLGVVIAIFPDQGRTQTVHNLAAYAGAILIPIWLLDIIIETWATVSIGVRIFSMAVVAFQLAVIGLYIFRQRFAKKHALVLENAFLIGWWAVLLLVGYL